MAFTTKEGSSSGFDLIPAVDYECVITNAEVKQIQTSGKWKVGFSFVIRNDVQQGQQNRFLFLDIWRKAESEMSDDDRAVDGFNFNQLCNVATAASLPTGQSFETLGDFLKVLIGRCIRVTVRHSTYNGRTEAKIAPFLGDNGGLHKTQFPECRHRARDVGQPPAYGSAPQNNGYSRQGSYPQGNGYNQQGNSYRQNTGYQQGGSYPPPAQPPAYGSAPQNNGYSRQGSYPQGNGYNQQGNSYRQNTGYQQGGSYPPPAQPPAYPPAYPPAGSFEEILSDGQVPF